MASYACGQWASCLLMLSLLCGCKEPPAPSAVSTPQRYRLIKVASTSSHNATTNTYHYNAAGQLAAYTIQAGSGEDAPKQTTVFDYDPQGRLTSAERLPAFSFLSGHLTYHYDDRNNLNRVTLFEDINQNSQFVLTQTIAVDYGLDQLPLTVTATTKNRMEVTHYTFQAGNVIETERAVASSSEMPQTIRYQHDDKPNPIYGLLIGVPTAETFNKNNIIYEGSERTYTNGLLTLLRTNVKDSPAVQSVITYAYEAY